MHAIPVERRAGGEGEQHLLEDAERQGGEPRGVVRPLQLIGLAAGTPLFTLSRSLDVGRVLSPHR